MTRTAFKQLSSELRKQLFQGQFHTNGAVLIVRQRKGIEVASLDNRSLSLPIDRSWMTKTNRRELLRLSRNTAPINLPN